MSDDKTRDPIDVARKVWPGLEWTDEVRGQDGLPLLEGICPDFPFWVSVDLDYSMVDGPDDFPRGWAVEVGPLDITTNDSDLRTALTEARRLTLARLEAAAALCREPYPVQVERHRGTGEAVLMLTEENGDPLPIVAAWLEMPDAEMTEDDGGAYLTLTEGGGWVRVRETVEDIRETLRRLAEEEAP